MQKYYFFYENKILSEKKGVVQHQENLLPIISILLNKTIRVIKT